MQIHLRCLLLLRRSDRAEPNAADDQTDDRRKDDHQNHCRSHSPHIVLRRTSIERHPCENVPTRSRGTDFSRNA